MKLSSLGLVFGGPLLLLSDRGGSASAATTEAIQMAAPRKLDDDGAIVVTDTAGFLEAVGPSLGSPTNPFKVWVDVAATIDYDEVFYRSGDGAGIELQESYLDVECIGYSDTNKCTLETGVNPGRFFIGLGPLDITFKGFEFIGGTTPNEGNGYEETNGGAFSFVLCRGRKTCTASFTDCDFINNTALEGGGAVFMDAGNPNPTTGKASGMSFMRCKFDSNAVENTNEGRGGAIHVVATDGSSRASLLIAETTFTNNDGNDIGNDIQGDGSVDLSCSETTTSGTERDVLVNVDGPPQTCSLTAIPSSSPSSSVLPSSTPSASAQPSVSPIPSSAPSGAPSDRSIITDTAGFIEAVQALRGSPTNPSKVWVDVAATIDFDEVLVASGDADGGGVFLQESYLDVECIGTEYSDTNKCKLETGVISSRFFAGQGPFDLAFKGFKFIGGTTPNDSDGFEDTHGGAFYFFSCGGRNTCTASFTDCDFINKGTALEGGGALFMIAGNPHPTTGKVSSVSFTRCKFDSNTAENTAGENGGGAIFTVAFGASSRASLSIIETAFANNDGNGNGDDILGYGQVDFFCSETTTSSGSENDVFVSGPLGPQTCSLTAYPSSSPSASPSVLPSSTPSASAQPTLAPSSYPTASVLPSIMPSSSTQPTHFPSALPTALPSVAPSFSSAPTTLWVVITRDDFESGWGEFKRFSGTGDAIRMSNLNSDQQDYVPQGNAALRIRDGNGIQSSVFHRHNHDVTGFSTLRVRFKFSARSMERDESFVLEYSSAGTSAGSWVVVKRYIKGPNANDGNFHFWNDQVYSDAAIMEAGSYDLDTTRARIRFRCDASGSGDYIYIDDVWFDGIVATVPSASPTQAPTILPTPLPSNFPSPFPTVEPTPDPTTVAPSMMPSASPTQAPTIPPTPLPSNLPTPFPTVEPTPFPTTVAPSMMPSASPTQAPTILPTPFPSNLPTPNPTVEPTPEEHESPTPGTWIDITYDDFEIGWGNFADGGTSDDDAARVTTSGEQQFIHQGTAALRIRGNYGASSSFLHTEDQNVIGYSNLRVSFWYFPRKLEAGKSFRLDYSSDGNSTWTTVKDFVSGADFVSGSFYNATVEFDSTGVSYALTNQARIRFQCVAAGRKDWVYIDEVSFQGFQSL